MDCPATIAASVGAPKATSDSAKRYTRESSGIILEPELRIVELPGKIQARSQQAGEVVSSKRVVFAFRE